MPIRGHAGQHLSHFPKIISVDLGGMARCTKSLTKSLSVTADGLHGQSPVLRVIEW
jgi:hypothetical protein